MLVTKWVDRANNFQIDPQVTQNIMLGADIVIEDQKIAKIAISQKVLYQSWNKKFCLLESSSATISRILSIFGGVDPDILCQKDSSISYFLEPVEVQKVKNRVFFRLSAAFGHHSLNPFFKP